MCVGMGELVYELVIVYEWVNVCMNRCERLLNALNVNVTRKLVPCGDCLQVQLRPHGLRPRPPRPCVVTNDDQISPLDPFNFQ